MGNSFAKGIVAGLLISLFVLILGAGVHNAGYEEGLREQQAIKEAVKEHKTAWGEGFEFGLEKGRNEGEVLGRLNEQVKQAQEKVDKVSQRP